MLYGYIPSTYWASAQSSSTPKTTTAPCCSSSLLLEILLYVHTGLHLLAVALAISVLNHKSNDLQAVELVVVGMSGALTTTLAIMGLWYRQRQFLLPLVVFLLSTIVLDSISIFYYFVSSPNAEPTYPRMSPISLYPNTDRMIPYLILKVVFSFWLVKSLISVYRKNLSIRTGRSPLRKQSPPSGDLGTVEKGGSGTDSNIPKQKVGQYSKFDNCQED